MATPDCGYVRREQRERVTGAATLSWEVGGLGQVCVYRVRNLTADGMQAVGRLPIPPGTRVFISGERYECLGQVRYCLEDAVERRIGLEFLSDPYRLGSARQAPPS